MKNVFANAAAAMLFVALIFPAIAMLFVSQLEGSERVREINVSTVDQLYAAVNNAKNVGATIHLAPGTYVLSAMSLEGVTHPNHGALHLKPGMSLIGSAERVDSNFDGVPDPVSSATPDDFAVPGTETKIDGSELSLPSKVRKSCEGKVSMPSDPTIAISRNNSISSLYLSGGGNIPIGEPALIPGDSVKNPSLSAQVQSTVLEGGLFTMTFANAGCNARHARSVLIFSNNVVRNATFGLLLANFRTGNVANDTSRGPEIKATIDSNLFYNLGTTALTARNIYGTDGGLITLEMTGNVFRNNGNNFVGFAGRSDSDAPPVGNRLRVTSRSDTFGEPFPGYPSVLLIGARFFEDLPEPRHCRLEAEFIHSNFVRDKPARRKTPEFSIIGGDGGGSDNHVTVLIRQATVKTSTGAPTFGTLLIQDETGSGTAPNTARLKGTLEAFMQTNQGFPAPEAKFFLKK